MGAEVQGVPGGPGVAEGPAADAADAGRPRFGDWVRRERELREISLFYLAARTKLTAERLREIEDGRETLVADGPGRGLARSLAQAIGADPDEAVRRLGVRAQPVARRRRGARPRSRTLWAPLAVRLVLGAVVLGGLAVGARWLLERATPAEPPVVYRPDYVHELLDDAPAPVGDPEAR